SYKSFRVKIAILSAEVAILSAELKKNLSTEIENLSAEVANLSAELRKIDILSMYRDTICCFKVFITEKIKEVNKEMENWTRIKNTLNVERYKNLKVVTNQLENILEPGLTYEEFNSLLGLKNISNSTFYKEFNLENLPEIKSHLKNTQFPDGWELTKQALTKIMDPLEEWLLLQQLPEETVTKTYSEYLVERSKRSTNIPLPEFRRPNEGVDKSKWKDMVPIKEASKGRKG
ncbi:13348_t:CDS:1, partial [Rhizophagus irregularis]